MKSQKQPLNDLSSLVELGPLKRKKLFQAVHDSLSKRSDRSKSEKKKGKGSNKGESSWKKKKLLVAMQSDEQSFKKSQKGVEDKGKKERKSKEKDKRTNSQESAKSKSEKKRARSKTTAAAGAKNHGENAKEGGSQEHDDATKLLEHLQALDQAKNTDSRNRGGVDEKMKKGVNDPKKPDNLDPAAPPPVTNHSLELQRQVCN
ncbi:unnamed protein product [Nippostrongylus brasiliensis]|uniref:Suppressor protein SRP40-like n=1 Tax=Nippostrongylus brasiliensis TaxID=27835 RepID=A0A0N4YSN0_NIPBR|nr:unnamed protein product [Nippostrongylus brasiliensis]